MTNDKIFSDEDVERWAKAIDSCKTTQEAARCHASFIDERIAAAFAEREKKLAQFAKLVPHVIAWQESLAKGNADIAAGRLTDHEEVKRECDHLPDAGQKVEQPAAAERAETESIDPAFRAAKRWHVGIGAAAALASIIREEYAACNQDHLSRAEAAEAKLAEVERELSEFKSLYQDAIHQVDSVFQVDCMRPMPLLPDFCKPGDNKFEAVPRLAEAYIAKLAKLAKLEAAVEQHWNRLHCEHPSPGIERYGARGFTPATHRTAVAALLAAGGE